MYYILPTLIFSIFLSAVGFSQDVDEKVKLVFTIHQSRDIYDKSTFGEPPQFAIWLEEQESHTVKTAYVTFKTGTGEFEGKIEGTMNKCFRLTPKGTGDKTFVNCCFRIGVFC